VTIRPIAHGEAGREQRCEIDGQPVLADDVEIGRAVQRAVRGYLVDEQRELVVRALELKSPMHELDVVEICVVGIDW
jgi:hypothetical protein